MKIRREFSDDPANIDPGNVLKDMLKPLLPPKQLERYAWETTKSGRKDNIHSLTVYIRQIRNMYSQMDLASKTSKAATCLTTVTPVSGPYPVAAIPSHLLAEGSDDDDDELEYETHTAVEAPKKPFSPYKKYSATEVKDSTISVDPKTSRPAFVRPPKVCTLCKKEHLLYSCPDFKMLAVKDKFSYVVDNKLCVHCLNPGHTVKECTFHPESACNLDGCKSMHHRQLHNRTESG